MLRVREEKEFIEFLLCMFPGQDVRVKFRTAEQRDLSGYWCWNLIEMEHRHTSAKTIREYHKHAMLKQYHDSIIKRRYRWKDVTKKLREIRREHSSEE
jgi:hypothetical protein